MRGYALNPMGNHGGSNYAGETGGWFNRFFNNESLVVSRSDERLKLCENCGKYFMKKKGVCPICKK